MLVVSEGEGLNEGEVGSAFAVRLVEMMRIERIQEEIDIVEWSSIILEECIV